MICRENCGACCIAASINTAIPGMPNGKPAGVSCVNLDTQTMRCRIYGSADYPTVCRKFIAAKDACGESRDEALQLIAALELATR